MTLMNEGSSRLGNPVFLLVPLDLLADYFQQLAVIFQLELHPIAAFSVELPAHLARIHSHQDLSYHLAVLVLLDGTLSGLARLERVLRLALVAHLMLEEKTEAAVDLGDVLGVYC